MYAAQEGRLRHVERFVDRKQVRTRHELPTLQSRSCKPSRDKILLESHFLAPIGGLLGAKELMEAPYY